MLKKLEKIIREKGTENIELTKHKNEYHVLHICQNDVPVPLFISKDKEEFLDYLKNHYQIDVESFKDKPKIIRVFVSGGLVTNVDNLPDGWNWKKIDYDIKDDWTELTEKDCGLCTKAEDCYIGIDEPGCEFVHFDKENRERIELIEKNRQEKCEEILQSWDKKDLIKDCLKDMNETEKQKFIDDNWVKL